VLAWAAWRLARLDPDAVMVSLHADHLIAPLDAFRETVDAAATIAISPAPSVRRTRRPSCTISEPKSPPSSSLLCRAIASDSPLRFTTRERVDTPALGVGAPVGAVNP